MNSQRFQFSLATPEDDAQLRRRMAEDWLEGQLSVSFRREPSYFAGCAVQGERTEVMYCRDSLTGEIVGMGSRSIRRAYLNGVAQPLGYVGDIRVAPEYRKGTLLGRGARFLRRLHEADPVPLYFGVILDGNQAAFETFGETRPLLPKLSDFGRILTPAIHLDFAKPAIVEPGLTISIAREDQMPEIIAFLERWMPEKQFAPAVDQALLSRCAGLRASDFLLAIRDHRIAGCCAGWDQQTVRQTHIEQYSTKLAMLRPFYNLAAAFTPLKALPSPGSRVPYLYLSFVAVEQNDVATFRVLVREFYRRYREGPWRYFIAGLHEADPLAAVLAEYRSIAAAGHLFICHYPEDAEAERQLDDRVPYIEMATV